MLLKYVGQLKPSMHRMMIVVFMDISDEDEEGANSLSFNDTIQLCDIADIFEHCINEGDTLTLKNI